MSQTKVQLINAKQTFDTSGVDNVGVITASSFSGDGSQLVGVGVGTTASVNTTGIITAVSFSGDGSGLTGVGFGTEDSGTTTGIITAGKFSGSGIGLTNIGGPVAGLVYSPAIGATSIDTGTNIEIIFSKPIQAGVGTITLRENAADGTIVESIDITSDAITIDTARLTINPTSDLGIGKTHYVVIPTGTVKDTYAGISSNVGITSYYFLTQSVPTDFNLFGWGYSVYGSGFNDKAYRSSPTQLPGTQWNGVISTINMAVATKSDGTYWTWGLNNNGQLGQNNRTERSSPIQVPGTQWTITNVDIARADKGAAFKTDGTLWLWGRDVSAGTLGNNTTNIPHSSPVQLPGTQWSHLALDYQSSGAIKTDGTLWMWGNNASYGRLGTNEINTAYSSPVQIPGTAWDSISLGRNGAALATKTDGTLWAWGGNSYGTLADNTILFKSSPTQIPGTQWDRISAGQNVSYISYATKTDGTLWAWGYNLKGALGDNSIIQRSSPVQVPGTQWAGIKAGYRYMVARKTDGTLWTWGFNENGELGVNDILYYSSPVQVPGTQWGRADTTETQGLGAGQYMTWCLQQP